MRNHQLDTFRFLLVALVVVGHFIEPLRVAPAARALYGFLYLFHVPALAMVCGRCSRGRLELRKNAVRLLLPMLVFQVLYEGRIDSTPCWLLWFLLSLFCWRLMLLVFRRLPHPIASSVLLALTAGYWGFGYELSGSRTLVFFPFFLVGHYDTRWSLSTRQAVGFLAAAALFVCVVPFDQRWLYGSYSYAALGFDQWYAAGFRLALMTIALGCSFACLALVPKRETLFSQLGSRTMPIYLLHGLIVLALIRAGAYASFGMGWFALSFWLTASIVTVALLSTRLTAQVTAPLFLRRLGE